MTKAVLAEQMGLSHFIKVSLDVVLSNTTQVLSHTQLANSASGVSKQR